MVKSRIDWQGDKLYFHDDAGGVWRVYDCIPRGERSRAVPLSDPRARQREFVRRDGTRRVLPFAADTPRAISPGKLAEQLRTSTPVSVPAVKQTSD